MGQQSSSFLRKKEGGLGGHGVYSAPPDKRWGAGLRWCWVAAAGKGPPPDQLWNADSQIRLAEVRGSTLHLRPAGALARSPVSAASLKRGAAAAAAAPVTRADILTRVSKKGYALFTRPDKGSGTLRRKSAELEPSESAAGTPQLRDDELCYGMQGVDSDVSVVVTQDGDETVRVDVRDATSGYDTKLLAGASRLCAHVCFVAATQQPAFSPHACSGATSARVTSLMQGARRCMGDGGRFSALALRRQERAYVTSRDPQLQQATSDKKTNGTGLLLDAMNSSSSVCGVITDRRDAAVTTYVISEQENPVPIPLHLRSSKCARVCFGGKVQCAECHAMADGDGKGNGRQWQKATWSMENALTQVTITPCLCCVVLCSAAVCSRSHHPCVGLCCAGYC